ncbi:MAG TPA: o-succinylbenzoate synthase [Jiangellaceae bacterium]|nr:o-succinylbenzoate synthase [Jiangellaceae bacterium]
MIGAETGELHVYAVPLRRRFRGIDVRQGVLIHGLAGWGEFSPFAEYDDAEAAAWWRAAEEAAGIGWPPPVRDKIPVNATVPAVPAAEVATVMAAFPGCGTAKVKIAEPGQTAADDQARLEAVRAVLGSAGHIRVDANGGWDLDMAARYLPLYDRAVGGLEYAEQPCATVEDMAALRRRVDIPIAADESIRRSDDPIRVVRLGAADVAVLKVQPMGGVRVCLRLAEELGLPVVVSSALETSVGIGAGVALAAALPELPFACGLGTAALLSRDVVDDPLVPVDGVLPVRRPEPDPASLALARADQATAAWWRDRARRAAKLA